MTPANVKQRVAILGGGPAALAAAFELTATEELRQKYDVTVHQLGWRLGGKGASGRNAAHCNRIEEHGLHVWFGFYENAFSMMRTCYEEAVKLDPRFGTLEDAFIPEYEGVQFEQYDGRWIPHCLKLPELPGKPGEAGFPDLLQVVEWAAGMLKDALGALWDDHPEVAGTRGAAFAMDDEAPAAAVVAPRLPPKVDRHQVVKEGTRLGMDMENWEEDPAVNLLELVRREAAEQPQVDAVVDVDVDGQRGLGEPAAKAFGFGHVMGQIWKLRFMAETLNGLRDWLWDGVVSKRLDHDRLRLNFMFLDLAAAMVNGIVSDKLWEKGFGEINDEEFRGWLRRHGAKEVTLKGCPLVRAVYSAAFCFDDGDVKRPNVAAGKAAQDAIRLPFLYKGAPMYKMSYGMGDTVFAPLYKVLRKRGVRFEFFRCITRLSLDDDKKAIDSIEYIQQADVLGDTYDPLLDLSRPCWPSEPIWKQLQDGETLFAQAVDFERKQNPLDRQPKLLTRDSEDEDGFDLVVLGIPIEALPPICGDLADADPDFKAMLDNRHTVMTQAFQIWMKQDAEQLGFPYPTASLTSCYVEPLDTYCDMSLTLDCEDWPDHECVTLVGYFCGVLPNEKATSQAAGDEYVRAKAIGYVDDHLGRLWPHFEWDLTVDPSGRSGADRFDAQYWRANFMPSERYVQTPAGSVQFRRWPHETPFHNLALAGDWTRNGIDGGAVEAAVTSGRLAARAISGSPEEVRGVCEWLTSDRGDVGWIPVPPGVIHA